VTAQRQRAVLPRDLLHDRVVLRALVPGDVEDVAKPVGGYDPDARTGVLKHGVRRDRRAVEQVLDVRDFDPRLGTRFGHTTLDGDRRVVARGRDLVDMVRPRIGVREDDVRERSPDIHAEEQHDVGQ
jgi:hypothetical protein